MYGFQPQKARPKAKPFANGGMIRGPGTGTSDDIKASIPDGSYIMPADSTRKIGQDKLNQMGANGDPVMVSNGEYQMPPEQVHALGAQVLDQVRNATHQPTKPQGFKPKDKPTAYFREGGLYDERRIPRPNAFGDAAAISNGGEQSPFVTAPSARAGVSAGQPRVSPLVAQATPKPAPSPRTNTLVDSISGANDASMRYSGFPMSPDQRGRVGEYFQQSEASRQSAEKAIQAGLPWSPGVVAPPTPSPAPSPNQPFVDSAPMPANDPGTRGLGFPPAQAPSNPLASAVAPGVYQHGRGQYSDSPDGMGFKPGMGNPSQRNIQAADSLIARNAAIDPQAQDQNAPTPGLSIMGGGGFGLRDPNALAERNALVSAGSLRAARERGFSPRGQSPADVALQNFYKDRAQGNELASAANIQGMRTQGDLTRTGMQEQGANQRASMTAALEGNKLAQAAQAQGFVNRSAAQMENLRNTLLDPKATPEQRKQAQEAILAIQGRQPQNEWGVQVTPTTKNLDGTTSMGSIVRYNKATGQTEVVQGGAQNAAPAVGTVQKGYKFKGGDPSNPENWEKA